jgi:hypothetical protein
MCTIVFIYEDMIGNDFGSGIRGANSGEAPEYSALSA